MAEDEFIRLRKRFALAIRRRRTELGLTQEDVAERLQIVARQYQKIESGQVNVTLRTIARIARVLETLPHRLL